MHANKRKRGNRLYRRIGKRIFDLVLAVILLPVIVTLIIMTSLVIFATEGRYIFFKQIRVGMSGEQFLIFKFRTMISSEGGEKKVELAWSNGIPSDFIFKENLDDPRITKLGRWLRKLSIDELPQFFNVVKGDMSFIGPRPEVPYFTQYYNSYQNDRLTVKPGITGWAQVNGRSNISHGEKIDFDRYYVEHYSFGLDLLILWKTILNLLKREGAY